MSAGMKRGMVLPAHRSSDGVVGTSLAYSSDDRVPNALPAADIYDRETQRPRTVGHVHRRPECPAGRHVWDIVESTIEHEIEDEQERCGYRYEHDFRAHLTCVRCGTVLAWEGRRTDRHVTTLEVEPLAAGDLVAQMVHSGSHDWHRYDVLRQGGNCNGLEVVGAVAPAMGQRGRRYFVGRLEEWPDGEHVEGKDALAALRAIVRRQRQIAAVAS